jgi:carbon starvation protein
MNSLWLVLGALAAFAVAYRYYGAFLAAKVAMLDDSRPTPAQRLKDGVDYHPTSRLVLFGHHFAAIAGPGPLVGPVIAAQWGYLPGFIWIVIGACLAGAVHDFVILWASVRQDGLSLPKIARANIGRVSGVTTSIATLFIIIVSLASVASVVVSALAESAWGMFTIIVTIPAALLTGWWMYKVRPGKVVEASVIGVTIVMLGVFLGRPFAESSLGSGLLLKPETLKVLLPAYAVIASVLPVWVLMCPRDYLSSYMKIGVMVVLAVGIFAAHPTLKMPATTPYLSTGTPIYVGSVWPFVCIVIMCGAISGFHSLIASGTTPKMISKESHIRPIGYGAMVVEGFVAVTALVAACALEPGDYFAINMAKADQAAFASSAETDHGWDVTPKELTALEQGTGEHLVGRPGGAVTLAVGMAKVFSGVPGLGALMSYWYHFVIMFEALFILTLLETGTRVARFVFQETVGSLGTQASSDAAGSPPSGPAKPRWAWNVGMSVATCFCWGSLLYLGDIATLWKVLGLANQLLASIALAVGTTYLLRHAPRRVHALCTGVPFVFVLGTTVVAGVQMLGQWWQKTGELQAKIAEAVLEGAALRTAVTEVLLYKIVLALAVIMLGLTAAITVDAVRCWFQILRRPATMKASVPAAAS